MAQTQQAFLEDSELDPCYLAAKVLRLEKEYADLVEKSQRLSEEKQALSGEIQSLQQTKICLEAEQKRLETERKRLTEQVSILEKREDPEARRRVDFLRDEMTSLIAKSVELQRSSLRKALTPKEGETEDDSVNAWKEDAIRCLEDQWPQSTSGGLLAFLGAILHVYMAVFGVFSRLGLLFAKGSVQVEIATAREKWRYEQNTAHTKWEQEQKKTHRDWEQKVKDDLAKLKEEKHSQEQDLADKKKSVDRELNQRKRDMQAKEADLQKRIQQVDAQLRALPRWRVAAIFLMLLDVAAVVLVLYSMG